MKTDVDEYISAGVFPFTAQPQASELTETKPGTTSPPGSSWDVGHNAAQCRKEQLPPRAFLIVLAVISPLG